MTEPFATDRTSSGMDDHVVTAAASDHSGGSTGLFETADQTPSGDSIGARGSLLERIVAWLRAGYPQGVPSTDYVALFAVLHRHLTDFEVAAIAEELVEDNPDSAIGQEEIEAAIARVALEQPAAGDVARVASHLAAGGWPLADPPVDPD
ncbi:DUF3349 domain-containing protein [Nocardia takedensis]